VAELHEHRPDPSLPSATSQSDLVFPSNRDILSYLHRYAETSP
jgi:hypothetical protein